MGINIRWKGGVYNFVNMYASCNTNNGRVMWRMLIDKRTNSSNEEWCLGGDFIEVCSREERLGVRETYSRRNMEAFKYFFEEMGVIQGKVLRIKIISGRSSLYFFFTFLVPISNCDFPSPLSPINKIHIAI